MATIKIVDSSTQKPIPYASVLSNKSDSTYTGDGTQTDLSGKAQVDLYNWSLNKGWNIVISSVGYSPKSVNITEVQDGDIYELDENQIGIGGVTISSLIKNNKKILIVLAIAIIIIISAILLSGEKSK